MSFLQPRAIETTITQVDEWTMAEEVTDKPWVSWVSHRVLSNPSMAALIKHHGYRAAIEAPWSCETLMVRSLPLWLVFKAKYQARLAYWAGLHRLYDWGVFHLEGPEGLMFSWRNVRLGRASHD